MACSRFSGCCCSVNHSPPDFDLSQLSSWEERNWQRFDRPVVKKVSMLNNLKIYIQRTGHVLSTTQDYWMRLANGEKFTQASPGFLADAGPAFIVEELRLRDGTTPVPAGGFTFNKGSWYPTLTMTLGVKRNIPGDGVEEVRSRVTAKEVSGGRYDVEVLMFDQRGMLVAISNHVTMATDIERNYAGRGRKRKI